MKFNDNIEENNYSIKRILKGSMVSVLITLILLFIFSIVLTYTKISENTSGAVVIVITAISIFIGSQMATLKLKKNGIINGGAIGLIYILILYILSSLVSRNFGCNMYSIIMIFASIVAGCLGGVIGVNMK